MEGLIAGDCMPAGCLKTLPEFAVPVWMSGWQFAHQSDMPLPYATRVSVTRSLRSYASGERATGGLDRNGTTTPADFGA